MRHLMILFIFLTLFLGTETIFYIYQKSKANPHVYLNLILMHTIFFNFLVLNVLLSFYLKLNILDSLTKFQQSLILDIGYVFSTMIETGLIYYMILIVLAIKKKKFSNRIKRVYFSIILILIACYILKMILGFQNISIFLLEFIYNYITDNIILVDIFLLINLFIFGRKLTDKNEKKLITSFTLLYLGRYSILLIYFPVSKIILYIIFLLPLIFANIVPVIWIKYYFLDYLKKQNVIKKITSVVEDICEKHNLSNRQQQILELLLEGKSNREIEESLFISYHTVKNHVYNIFKKLGIKNRFELINLISNQNNSVI